MAVITIKGTRVPRIRERVGFSAEQMERVAQVGIEAIRDRTARAQNKLDNPMEALSNKYRERKMRRGGQGIRNIRLTGRTMREMKVIESAENAAKVGFDDPKARRAGHFRNVFDQWFGISPTDGRAVDDAIIEEHKLNLRRAFE